MIREQLKSPMWDTVGLSSCDFRPTFDGDFHNLFTCVSPESTPAATQAAMEQHTREIAQWVLAHREEFGTGDRFQVIVGWPASVRQTGRQVVKTGGDFEAISRLADGTTEILPTRGWTIQVFEKETTEQSPVGDRPGGPPEE